MLSRMKDIRTGNKCIRLNKKHLVVKTKNNARTTALERLVAKIYGLVIKLPFQFPEVEFWRPKYKGWCKIIISVIFDAYQYHAYQ